MNLDKTWDPALTILQWTRTPTEQSDNLGDIVSLVGAGAPEARLSVAINHYHLQTRTNQRSACSETTVVEYICNHT